MKQKAKVLDTFTVEGVEIRTQLRTKNDWRSFHFWNGFNIGRGYRGSYKGRTVTYKDFLPKGLERHHIFYNDTDIDTGVVMITHNEHRDEHRDMLTGRFIGGDFSG